MSKNTRILLAVIGCVVVGAVWSELFPPPSLPPSPENAGQTQTGSTPGADPSFQVDCAQDVRKCHDQGLTQLKSSGTEDAVGLARGLYLLRSACDQAYVPACESLMSAYADPEVREYDDYTLVEAFDQAIFPRLALGCHGADKVTPTIGVRRLAG